MRIMRSHMDLSVLFEPAQLIFTIPLLISFMFGGLALIGLFEFDGFDIDMDTDVDVGPGVGADLGADADIGTNADTGADGGVATDADVDADVDMDADAEADAGSGGGLLQLLGFGYVPFTLSLVLLCFSFGWTGLLLSSLFGASVAGVVGGGVAASVVLALPAFLAAGIVTAPLSRFLAPLFQDYGKATKTYELVGKTGVLTTGSVSETFGSASVRVPGRSPIEVSARVQDSADAEAIRYGDPVLIYDHDAEKNVYYVTPHDPDDP
jgi:hypothetical protein